MVVKLTIKSNARNKAGKLLSGIQKKIEDEANKELKATSEAIVKAMKKYPPKRPKQKYVRTFTLRNSWKVVKVEKGFSGKRVKTLGYTVSSDAKQKGRRYTKYVVGDAKGNWQNQTYHAGRWQLFKDVVDDQMKKLRKKVVEKIKLTIGRRNIAR